MNKILDYEQILYMLQKKTRVNELPPIGYTTFGFPIKHYIYGYGNYHIVITGAMHGAEIISTNLVMLLMDYIPQYIDRSIFTIHFIPMLNPEGYLISTSAVRKIIPRKMPNIIAQKIIKEYVKQYNSQNLKYQNIFSSVTYKCISEKYMLLQKNIRYLYNVYNIPIGTLQVWSSNGCGIDLNQNCPFNPKLNFIKSNTILYGNGAYKNIVVSQPGPIGCPSRTSCFKYEPETYCFRKFLLRFRNKICAYFNFHSAENTIFYKPIFQTNFEANAFFKKENLSVNVYPNISKLCRYNKSIAETYASYTSHKLYEGNISNYCFNDLLRLEIPGDLLIELSPNEGNPLSAFEDGIYEKTLHDNLLATVNTIKVLPRL